MAKMAPIDWQLCGHAEDRQKFRREQVTGSKETKRFEAQKYLSYKLKVQHDKKWFYKITLKLYYIKK